MKNPVIYISEEYYKRYHPNIDDMLGGDKWFREDQDGHIYLFPTGLIEKNKKSEINNLIQQGISKASDLSNNEPLRKWRWLEAKLNDYYSRN